MKCCAVLLIAIVAVGAHPPLAEPPQSFDDAEIAQHIAALGSERWDDRQAATQAILEFGPAAVPALRPLLESHPDPEVRSRVEWLLSVLIPPVYQVELIRLGGDAMPLAPLEWARTTFPERARGEVETRSSSGSGRRLHLVVEGAKSLYRLEVSIGVERGALEMSGDLALDTFTLIESEERFSVEDAAGRITVERERGIWVARLHRSEGAPPQRPLEDSVGIVSLLETALGEALTGEVEQKRDALRAAAAWGRLDLLPALSDLPKQLRREGTLARLVAGDAEALPLLEKIFADHVEDLDPLDKRLESEVTQALAAAGSEVALDHLVERFSQSALWEQHLASGVLAARLDDPAFVAGHGERVLGAILDPGGMAGVYWADGLVVHLLQKLQDVLPPDVFVEGFRGVIDEVLGDAGGAGGIRLRVMLRVLLRTLRSSEIPTEEWFNPLRQLLRGSFLDDAFAVLLDRWSVGALDDEHWREAWQTLATNLSEGDAGLLYRTRNCLTQVLEAPKLPPEDRRELWVQQLRCYPLEKQNLRVQVDRELAAQFGELADRAPQSNANLAAWMLRSEQWQQRLESLPAESFLPPEVAEVEPLILTIADLRIDQDRGEVTLVDCRSEWVTPGVGMVEIAPDLENRSMRIDAHVAVGRPGMYRMLRGSIINVRRPIAQHLRVRWRHMEYVAAAGHLELLSADRPRVVLFESLAYLEPKDALDSPDAPIPDDSPELLWEKLRRRIVDDLRTAQTPFRREYLQAISRFRIDEALDYLSERFEQKPDSELARALLALGDLRGRELLLQSAKPGERDAAEILGDLLRAGEPAALQPTLDWIEDPPRNGVGYLHQLIQTLDRAIEDPRLKPHLEEQRLMRALVIAMDHPNLAALVIPLLRRRTGLDFGYYEAFQITDSEDRAVAQQAALEAWRNWWGEQPGGAPIDEPEGGKPTPLPPERPKRAPGG